MKQFPGMLLILSAVVLISGCSRSGKDTQSAENIRYVRDSTGNKVAVPLNIEKIATFPAPHPHIIVYLDGTGQRIIGLHPLAKSAAEVSVLAKIAPELLAVSDNFLSGSMLNAEELLRLNPDVFFTDQVLQGMEALEQADLPVLYLGLEKEGNVFSPEKSIADWIEITAEVLGTEKIKAGRIMDEWRETRKYIEEKIKSIPDTERKKVLVLFRPRALLVAGGNSFGQYWIDATGGINTADEISGTHPAMSKIADFEQILKWNPDIIYITNFEETMPDDLYFNRIQSQEWETVNAVQNRQVYKIPLGIYRWYPPGLDGPLMLKWMAQKNYPHLFEWNMEDEIEQFYIRYFNYNLSREEVGKILSPEGSGTF